LIYRQELVRFGPVWSGLGSTLEDLEEVSGQFCKDAEQLLDRGLQDAGYWVDLVNPAAIKQFEGLKYINDRYDAFWLIHLMRLVVLKTGYIYPREARGIRDMLRRRMQLVRTASGQLISLQSQIWRSTGVRVSSWELCKLLYQVSLEDQAVRLAAESNLRVYRAIQVEVDQLEQWGMARTKSKPEFAVITTMTGVGAIPGMTILLETGDIGPFKNVGNYAS
jgi:transposase